jgi:hypothetical protein
MKTQEINLSISELEILCDAISFTYLKAKRTVDSFSRAFPDVMKESLQRIQKELIEKSSNYEKDVTFQIKNL